MTDRFTLYCITFVNADTGITDRAGGCWSSKAKALAHAEWLRGTKWATDVIVWKGEPGGERV